MFPGRISLTPIVALHVLPLLIFAIVHGAVVYGRRGILIFILLFLIIGNIVENLSIHTGFPFGHYVFTDIMGPKILAVPILLGLAYVGMGYLSWTVARAIFRNAPDFLAGSRLFTVPLVAAFGMTVWDLAMDPVWSTILHAWIWRDGGIYFGVPISNFVGWYFSVYVVYQLLALYLRKFADTLISAPLSFSRLGVLLYGVSAAGNILLIIPRDRFTSVLDATGAAWAGSSIVYACLLVSLLGMGGFTLLGWFRLLATHR
jgi:putative membrane protein